MVSLRLCERLFLFLIQGDNNLRLPVIAVKGREMGRGILIFCQNINTSENQKRTIETYHGDSIVRLSAFFIHCRGPTYRKCKSRRGEEFENGEIGQHPRSHVKGPFGNYTAPS